MGTFRAEYVRCGKPNCGSCPHGPYWYEYFREDGKLRKRYHGKVDPRKRSQGRGGTAGGQTSPKPHSHDRIFCNRTASVDLACEILGLTGREGMADARRLYGRLIMVHHPDRGGDRDVCARITAAWSYLKAARGW